jgi:transposase
MKGRKASKIDGINDFNFDLLAKSTSNPRERIRYLAFSHIQEGKSFTEAASMVRVQLRTLMNWVAKFKTHQIEGLKDRKGRGAHPHLAPEIMSLLDRQCLSYSIIVREGASKEKIYSH